MNLLAISSTLIPAGRDFASLGGEIILACAVIAILLAPFFTSKPSSLVSGTIAMAGVIGAFLFTLAEQPIRGGTFRDLMLIDAAAIFWEQILLVFMAGLLLMWFITSRRQHSGQDSPEFFTLLLTSTIGMMLMGQTSNLLMVVLVTEIASMPSYLLAGFRKTNRRASESALKFVLFGAVCTAIMIYGISLLYGQHGTLDIHGIARSISGVGSISLVTMIGLLAVFAGLLFKISGVPLHFWAPDVLEGTTADVAAFLSVASKSAGIVLLARLASALAPASESLVTAMAITIGISSVASMIVGNFAAMQQQSVKRMLAYSSIAHAGYMLAAVAMVLPSHVESALIVVGIYLAIYLFMQLGAFAVVGEVEARHGNDLIASFRGLSTLAPVSSAAMAIAMFSMIGLPPFAGLWAKLKVMLLLADVGGWWWVLVLSIAVNSIVSIGFYGRVLRAMYLEKPDAGANLPRYGPLAGLVGGLCALALVVLFVFLAPLETTSRRMGDLLNLDRHSGGSESKSE